MSFFFKIGDEEIHDETMSEKCNSCKKVADRCDVTSTAVVSHSAVRGEEKLRETRSSIC